jgi:hypothetical protein
MIVVGMHGHKAVVQSASKFYVYDVRKPTKMERFLVWLMGWRLAQ